MQHLKIELNRVKGDKVVRHGTIDRNIDRTRRYTATVDKC